jgi:hypothetical protein
MHFCAGRCRNQIVAYSIHYKGDFSDALLGAASCKTPTNQFRKLLLYPPELRGQPFLILRGNQIAAVLETADRFSVRPLAGRWPPELRGYEGAARPWVLRHCSGLTNISNDRLAEQFPSDLAPPSASFLVRRRGFTLTLRASPVKLQSKSHLPRAERTRLRVNASAKRGADLRPIWPCATTRSPLHLKFEPGCKSAAL